MDDFTTVLFMLALPAAAIVFLSLVWARGWLRIGLTVGVFLLPLLLLVFLASPAFHSNAYMAGLGLAILGGIFFMGAVVGAVLGGIVIAVRYWRRGKAA